MVEKIDGQPANLGTAALKLPRKGNVDRQHVTLTVLFKAGDNHPIRQTLYAALGGSLLKSAYVNGIRKLSDLKRGQIVRLAGSGAAVVEEIWALGDNYYGRFRCQDGLVVQLSEAEEAMIGTLTKVSAAQPL
jgi:hypothetical protein